MKEPIRIYVAGPMSGREITYLENIRKGIRKAVELLHLGITPFCPFIDYPFFLSLYDGETITEEQIKKYSMDWLDVCDGILLINGWEFSKGSIAEKQRAEKLGLPVFYDINQVSTFYGLTN